MIQVIPVQRARLPIVAAAAFALGVLAATSASHLAVGAATPNTNVSVEARSVPLQPLRLAPSDSVGACSRGAYVTGDMAGDASPATVYATLCGGR